MTKVVTAEYDADKQELRLLEPLDGVADGEKVVVTIESRGEPREPNDETRPTRGQHHTA